MASRLQTFRKWLQQQKFHNKMEQVRELEMWLKCFERYFMVSNLPLSAEELKEATLRDYSEELKVAGDVIFRISQLCAAILPEEKISYSSFAKYVESSMRQVHRTDGFTRKLQKQDKPDENVNSLMEALLDIRAVILELSALSKLPYLCFTGVGKMIVRELGHGVYIEFLLQKKYVPLFDQIRNIKIINVIRAIQVRDYRRTLAGMFLDLFRALRFLEFARSQNQDAQTLKRSLLVFSHLHADLRLLIRHMEDEFVKKRHPDHHFAELVEATTYSLSMEIKKVMQRELVGTASLQQYDLIQSKTQNSLGILANAIQQVVYSIAQYFDSTLVGGELFPDYVTKLEQSLKLRIDLDDLLDYSKRFAKTTNLSNLPSLVKKVESFRLGSMKYLMFKDWMEFDNFYNEIAACKTSGNLTFSLQRFNAFLTTIVKEVNKRAILQS